MEMGDGLPGGRAVIDSDVVGVGFQLPVQAALRFVQQGKQGLPFLGVEIKERGDMPAGDDERVARGNWKTIPDDEALQVCE